MGTIERRRALAACVALGVAGYSHAANWEIEPSINVAATYTDNLRLQPDDRAEGELVLELMPGIAINGSGKNFEAEFNYRLQGLLYSGNSNLNDTLSYSRANGTVKLVGESLFLDFNGSIGQQIINPAGRVAISPVSVSGNRTEVTRFSVSPYFQRELGKTSSIRIAYNFGLIDYDKATIPDAPGANDRLNDSTSNGVSIGIAGNPPGSPLSWRLDAARTRIDYDTVAPDTSRDVRLQRVGAELAWLFSNRVSLFVGGGDEDNQFRGISGPFKIDGAFWHAGLRGKLDPVTTYNLSVGEQHFGDSYQFRLARDAKLLKTVLSYLEETTTVGQQQTNYEALFRFLSEITGVELPTPGISIYVRKRLSLESTLKLAQSRWRLNLYSENRDYLTPFSAFDDTEGDLGSDGVLGTALSWTWTARPRTEFSIDFGWQRFDLRTNTNEPEDTRLQLRLKRDLANDLSLNARMWRNVRSATVPAGEYEENAISIGLNKIF